VTPDTQVSIRLYWASVAPTAILAVLCVFLRIDQTDFALAVVGGFLLILGLDQTAVLAMSGKPRAWGGWWVGQSVTALAGGVFAAIFATSGSLALLSWVIVVWSVLAGGSSLLRGLRMTTAEPVRRDWISLGLMTLLLAGAVALVPASVVWTMGLLGAWASIVTVFSVIAALSARSVVVGETEGEED
jgi:hypothetical protein